MRSDINGFYCRLSSCTKKFVNSQSRSRHEKTCQYRTEESKVKPSKQRIIKPVFDDHSELYKCIDSNAAPTYQDVDFRHADNSNGIHEILLEEKKISPSSTALHEGASTRNKSSLPIPRELQEVNPIRRPSSSLDTSFEDEILNNDDTLPEMYVIPHNCVSPEVSLYEESINSDYSLTEDPTESQQLGIKKKHSSEIEDELSKYSQVQDNEEEQQHSYRCTHYPKCIKRENELFCASLVDTLDRLDSRKQRLAKVKFQQILYDLEYNFNEQMSL